MNEDRTPPVMPRLADVALDLDEFKRRHPFEGIVWQKVRAPRVWRPRPGESLIGYFHGTTKRTGSFGEYTVVQLVVPGDGIWMISGNAVVQLVAASSALPGDALKIVFHGLKDLPKTPETPEGEVRRKKQFDVYTARGSNG